MMMMMMMMMMMKSRLAKMILPPGATDCHSKGGRDKEASGGVGTDAGLFKSQFAVTENNDVCDDCLNWGTISCSIG